MLTINESFLKTDIDRLALDHLFSVGAIVEKVDRPPHKIKSPKIPKGRIGWKRYDATNNGGCVQCGDFGPTSHKDTPYGMDLCQRCFKVHADSIFAGLKPSDEVPF